jgi:hypothetical protein
MNTVMIPQVTFKNIIADGKRVETAYARLFEIARRNILSKRLLTSSLTQKYIEVQDGKSIFNNRRGIQEVAC